jgi:hypothetical protein
MIGYLALWSFSSIVFFTFAHNIIWPYALPALPAFAILAAEFLTTKRFAISREQNVAASLSVPLNDAGNAISLRMLAAGFAAPIALLIMTLVYTDDQQILLKSSQRDSADFYMQTRPAAASGLYYFRRRYYSGEFYSDGKAQVASLADIGQLLNNAEIDYLVVQDDDLKKIPAAQRTHFDVRTHLGKFVVLEERGSSAATMIGSREGATRPATRPKI